MNFTTTLSSKGQITVPVAVARRIRFTPGMRVRIYPTRDGFRAVLHRPSRILQFAGDLKSPTMQMTDQQKGQRSGYRVLFDPVPVTEKKLRHLTFPQLILVHDLATASSSVGPDAVAPEASAALYLKGWIRPMVSTGDRQRWRLAITFTEEQLYLIQELINHKSQREVSR